MEAELEKFRQRKQREEKKAEIKAKIKRATDSWTRSLCEALLPNWNEEEEPGDDDNPDPGTSSEDSPSNPANKWLMYAVIFLRFLGWLFIFIGFVKIGFGAVFFTISLLIFIYWNTRKGRRKRKGEVSAYSVFNKDCKSIDGTLKAEHLEKQLLYRS